VYRGGGVNREAVLNRGLENGCEEMVGTEGVGMEAADRGRRS